MRGGAVIEYPGKITGYVVMASIVASAAGLILGYHLGQTTGVMARIPELEEALPWKESGQVESTYTQIIPLFTSSAFLAALYCCPLASYFTIACGRKHVLITGAAYFLVGSLVSAFALGFRAFSLGRIMLAVGVALINQSAPLYLVEMAPHGLRRSLNLMFQLAITVGIITANLVNCNYDKVHRMWSLGGAAVPGLVVFVGLMFLPDTPNSLLERSQPNQAKYLLKKIRGTYDVTQEFNQLVAANEASNQIISPWVKLRQDPKYRPQLMFAIAVPLFQSFTGITWVMFYAPWFFQRNPPGMELQLLERDMYLSALIFSVVNVVATFIGIYAIDTMCRRSLFIFGRRQMFIFLTAIGVIITDRFGVGGVAILGNVYAGVVVAGVCISFAGYSSSLIPLGGLFPSREIFSREVPSAAQSVNLAVHIICIHVIGQLFLWTISTLKFGLFFGFTIIVLGVSVPVPVPVTGI